MNTHTPLHPIKETYFGLAKYPPGGSLGPRIQRGVQFVYLISGGLEIEVDGVRSQVNPGHLVLMLPGREESYFFHPDIESQHSWCLLDFDPLPRTWLAYLATLPSQIAVTSEMEQLLELGIMVTASDALDHSVVLNRLGEALLQFYLAAVSVPEDQRVQSMPKALRKACRFIAQHYDQKLTLDEIAQHAHCSVNHLINLFNRVLDTTPSKYLWRWRIKQAEGLLRHTDLPINLISEQCGFGSAFHFSRLFKAEFGVPPKVFRQQLDKSAVLFWIGFD